MRYILLTILLCLGDISFGQAVWKGYTYNAPVCNKPNCAMCNAIRAQLSAQSTPTAYVPQVSTPQVQNQQIGNLVLNRGETVPSATARVMEGPQYTTIYETQTVVERVKRCNGKQCWYENVTKLVQVPRQALNNVSFRNEVPPQVVTNVVQNTIVPTPAPVVKNDISLDLVPTPPEAVEILVELLRPTPNDIFIEPGCGDGRVLKAISRLCPAIGIELNEKTAELARKNLAGEALVLVEDATQSDYTRATIVSMYLYPDVMEKIVPLLQPGTRVVSYCHTIPGIKCKEYTVKGHTFYVGVK